MTSPAVCVQQQQQLKSWQVPLLTQTCPRRPFSRVSGSRPRANFVVKTKGTTSRCFVQGPLWGKTVQCRNRCGRKDQHNGFQAHNWCKEHDFPEWGQAMQDQAPEFVAPPPPPRWTRASTPPELRGSSRSASPPPAGTGHLFIQPPPGDGTSLTHTAADQQAWRERVQGSTIPQLRRWLARRGLSTSGAKLQLVQSVLVAALAKPPGADDYALTPWHEEGAAHLRKCLNNVRQQLASATNGQSSA